MGDRAWIEPEAPPCKLNVDVDPPVDFSVLPVSWAPDVVTLENVGATNVEYTKIQDAGKAGSGAPDLAEMEYFVLPSFEITKSLADLTPYGVNAYKANEVPSAWSQVSQGNAVYAMPVDVGPLALYYNSAVMSKYGLTVPTTWAQYAADAAKLKKADPGATLGTVDWTDPLRSRAQIRFFLLGQKIRQLVIHATRRARPLLQDCDLIGRQQRLIIRRAVIT